MTCDRPRQAAAWILGPDGRLTVPDNAAEAAVPDGAGLPAPPAPDGQARPAETADGPGTLAITPLASGDGLRIDGEIDLSAREPFGRALAALPGGDVHLHLGGLRFIDAAGARALLTCAGRLAPGGRLLLHDPPYVLTRIIELTCPATQAPARPGMPGRARRQNS